MDFLPRSWFIMGGAPKDLSGDSFATPIPQGQALNQRAQNWLQETIVDPMGRAGYPDMGAAMATPFGVAADVLIPQSYGDLLGALPPFKGGGKLIPFEGSPWEKMRNERVEKGLQGMQERIVDRMPPEPILDEKGHKWVDLDDFDGDIVPKGTGVSLTDGYGEEITGHLLKDHDIGAFGTDYVHIKGSDGKTYKVKSWDASDILVQSHYIKPVKE